MLPFAFLGVILISVGSAYFEPASQAALPNIVAPEELGPANVLMGSTWGTMLAVGAALGGAVTMRFGRNTSFIVDAISFLFSAGLLWLMRARFEEHREHHHEQPPLVQSIRETARYARAHPRVLALLTSKGGYGLGAGVVAMLSVFGKEVFQAGAFGIGLLFAARGVGALLGPFLVRAIARHDDLQYASIGPSVLLFGIGYAALGLSKTLLIGSVAILLGHIGGGAQWQTSTYGLQRETPDAIRGRVFAADWGLCTLTMSISSVVCGIAADHFGATVATVATASICIAWAIFWSAWTRKLWKTV
jgi:MFS family permease